MDADRFDALSRALTDARSRRGALAALLGGTLGLLGLTVTESKKKKKKKKKKRPTTITPEPTTQIPAPPPPPPTCTNCGDECINTLTNRDHCGRCNRRCDTGKVCRNGGCFATCPETTPCGPITPCGNTDRCNCVQRADSLENVCIWNGGTEFPVLCEDLIDCSVNPCPSGQVCVDRCCGSLTKFCIIPCPDQPD